MSVPIRSERTHSWSRRGASGPKRSSISHIRDHLDPITAAGRTLPGRPDVVLAMFAGLLDGFGSQWQMSGGRFGDRRVDDDEAIDALTDFVYRALNGRPG